MLEFILSTESACDLTEEQIKKYDVKIAPISFMVDKKEYCDGGDMPPLALCSLMREGASTNTFQINEYTAKEYLETLLKSGKDVLHVSFTSTMSGTYNNFVRVAEELNETHQNKVYVVDSLCQSAGVGALICLVAKKAIESKFTAREAKEFVENSRQNIAHVFTVETLKYLARGGRISGATALLANMMAIKPVMIMDKDGKIATTQKAMGRRKALSATVEKVKENFNGRLNEIFVRHADCEQDALLVVEKIKSAFPDAQVDLGLFGSTITCHCGPGTIAVFFTADERKA